MYDWYSYSCFSELIGWGNPKLGKIYLSLDLLGPLWLIRRLFPGHSALLEVENLLWGCWDSILTSQKAVDNSLFLGPFGAFLGRLLWDRPGPSASKGSADLFPTLFLWFCVPEGC